MDSGGGLDELAVASPAALMYTEVYKVWLDLEELD
jgi:hypothetical protein